MKIYTKGTFAYVCYAVTFVCCITISCGKEIPKGRIPNGYIAITFDDASINNWYSNLALMDSLDIKATFYISQYHTLKSEEKKKLFEIQNHGHEIAYHTSNHQDLKILMNSPSGWDKVNREICEDMEMMKRDGFDVTNFAFPYGSHDTELDRRILKKFKTVRALSNRTNY